MTRPVPILMFHSISVAPEGARTPSLYVSPRRFRSYVDLLARLGYRGVSVGELTRRRLEGEEHYAKEKEKLVGITFDDGYADNVEEALPVLREYGFTATCYVTSGSIGAFNAWDADVLRVRTRMMTRRQVRAWHDAGMEVGAHTLSHCDLSACAGEREVHEEIVGAKAMLEDLIGSDVSHFSYPFGRYDLRAVAAVRAAGFATAVTVREGRARRTDDRLALPRLYVGGNYLMPLVLARVLTPLGDWAPRGP